MNIESSHEPSTFLNQLIQMLYLKAHQRNAGIETAERSDLIVIDNAEDLELVSRNPDTFTKNYSSISVLGTSRFNTDGDIWRKRKEITQPAYNEAAKSSRTKFVYDVYEDVLLKQKPDSIAALQTALFEASVRIFCAAFGSQGSPAEIVAQIDDLRHGLRWLQFLSWHGERKRELAEATSHVTEVLDNLTKIFSLDDRNNEIWKHFSQPESEIPQYSPIEELVMNIFAGIETTVATLSWAADRLGTSRQVQQRLFEEVQTATGRYDYCECFINETMRYFPPIPYVTREVQQRTRLAARVAEPANLVLVSIIGLHRNAAYWSQPDVFHSARPEFMDNTYNRNAFVPFLTGPRVCGGMRLARVELLQGLKVLVRHFQIERTGDEVHFDYTLAMRPRDKGAIRIVSRQDL